MCIEINDMVIFTPSKHSLSFPCRVIDIDIDINTTKERTYLLLFLDGFLKDTTVRSQLKNLKITYAKEKGNIGTTMVLKIVWNSIYNLPRKDGYNYIVMLDTDVIVSADFNEGIFTHPLMPAEVMYWCKVVNSYE